MRTRLRATGRKENLLSFCMQMYLCLTEKERGRDKLMQHGGKWRGSCALNRRQGVVRLMQMEWGLLGPSGCDLHDCELYLWPLKPTAVSHWCKRCLEPSRGTPRTSETNTSHMIGDLVSRLLRWSTYSARALIWMTPVCQKHQDLPP